MPVRIRERQGGEPDLPGLRSQSGEGCPAFQGRNVQQVVQRGRIVAQAVGLDPDLSQRFVAIATLVYADTKLDPTGHLTPISNSYFELFDDTTSEPSRHHNIRLAPYRQSSKNSNPIVH